MGAPPQPRRLSFLYALALGVNGRIDIAVMFRTAGGALPDAPIQRCFGHFVTTSMTDLNRDTRGLNGSQ